MHIIGIDIGSSSVKVAKCVREGDTLRVVATWLEEIASFENDASYNVHVVSALKRALYKIDVRNSIVISSINGQRCAIKEEIVPYMAKQELNQAIRLEAKNYFPFSIEAHDLDFEVAGELSEKGIKKYDCLIAVGPKDLIEKNIAILRSAGVKPYSITPSSYALQSLITNLNLRESGAYCLVDIGERYTELVIRSNARADDNLSKGLIFSRKIPISGKDFTQALTGVLASDKGTMGLSLIEAEKIKRDIGIPLKTNPDDMIDGKISSMQAQSMLQSPLDQLANEIERSFDFYREETGIGKINSLILFGGGASLKNLSAFLADALGIEVRVGDSLTGVKFEEDATKTPNLPFHRIALAAGLALGYPYGANLLPKEIREVKKRAFTRIIINISAILVIFMLFSIYFGLRIRLNNLNKRIPVAQAELAALNPLLKEALTQNLANKVLMDEPYWEDIIKELSNIIPAGICIQEISMQNKVITMKGTSSREGGEEHISKFIIELEKGLFREVKLVKTEKQESETGYEFELTCWVDQP